MKFASRLRAVAFAALAGLSLTAAASAPASAASGSIRFNVVKAGFVVGGQYGKGVLSFRGRRVPISIGGASYGFLFGASETNFSGRVSNIRRASDVAGVYAAAGAGVTIIRGVQTIILTNQNGAVLTLRGNQSGLQINADLSGLAITIP